MYKILLLALSILFISNPAKAQTEIEKMLGDINGKVDEIVIKSDGKTYTYSGDEAEKLFSAMKKNKETKSFSFVTKDKKHISGDSLKKKIIIKEIDSDNDEKEIMVFVDEDHEGLAGELHKVEKKVIVSGEGDKKVVTITTDENGKENIEVLEGKAADDYLGKMKTENHCKGKIEDDGCCTKKQKKIIIEKEVEKK